MRQIHLPIQRMVQTNKIKRLFHFLNVGSPDNFLPASMSLLNVTFSNSLQSDSMPYIQEAVS